VSLFPRSRRFSASQHKDVGLKKLVYSYLVAYADANPTCREMALLTINSFQRDLSDSNQLIRAMALRVLTSIRVREVSQIQLMSLKKCASDSSPYVRKTAAHACGKIFQIDVDCKGELCEIIERLLNDKNTQVLSSAVAAFAEVSPEDLPLLNPVYRKLCALLADLDDWGQITALGVLTRYARANFTKPDPAATPEEAKKTNFYGEDSEEEEDSEEDSDEESEEEPEPVAEEQGSSLPEDHAMLLRSALPLLRSRNSGVVMAVASLYHYVGTTDPATLSKVGRALVRVMRNHREIQFIVLTNVVTFAKDSPDMLRKFLKDFFIAESEPTFVRRMKVDVLAALASADNVTSILREFTRYVKDDDKDFVRHAIQALVRVANALPEVADRCLKGLMGLVSTDSDVVVAEAVVAIRQLLQQHPQHDALIVRLAKKMDKIAMPSARAAIVWILGEFQGKARVAAMAPDALRQLAKSFKTESPEVKAQIVNLAAKTALWQSGNSVVQLLLRYVLELARYDSDYDLRDRARLLRVLLLGSEGLTALAADAVEEAGAFIAVVKSGEAASEDLTIAEKEAAAAAAAAAGGEEGAEAGEGSGAGAQASSPARARGESSVVPAAVAAVHAIDLGDRMRAVLLTTKPPPLIEATLESSSTGAFSMGSLSFMVGHSAKGFLPVPTWADVATPAKVREPINEDDERKTTKKKVVESSEEEESSEESSEEESSEEESSEEEAPRKGGRAPAGGRRVVKGEESEDEDEDDSEEGSEEDSD